jgi:hypothetical protein
MLGLICDADFQGLAFSDFQASFNYWTDRGYWPETLSTGNTLAGSFRPGPPRPVWAGMNERQFRRQCARQAEQQYAPHQVSVSGGGFRFDEGFTALGYPVLQADEEQHPAFSCIWKPTDYETDTKLLELADFELVNLKKAAGGWVLHDFCGYSADGSAAGVHVVATWSRRPHGRWVAAVNLTPSQVRTQRAQMEAEGYQPSRISAWWAGRHIRYATIYEQLLDPADWQLHVDMSGPLCQTRHQYLTNLGYVLHHVCGQTGRYSAIWMR